MIVHSVVLTYVVWVLAASSLPLAALNIFQWKTHDQMCERIRKFKRRFIAERRNHRSTEQKLARAETLRRLDFRRAVYYRHLRWSEKKQKEESRQQLVTTELKLAAEQERGSIRTFLMNLLNRVIPFATQSA